VARLDANDVETQGAIGRPAGRRTDDWEFDLPATYVYEFLYLQCDHNGGRRDFGPQGKYNATPLWPEALSFFMNQIEKG
jgi:hypothetical protein